MTRAEFATAFQWLAAALREPQDETGLTQQAYFDALGDLSPQAILGGAKAIAQTPDRKWFPSTGEWLAAARAWDSQERHKVLALPPGRDEPWRLDCASCEDTGWIVGLTCDGTERGLCGRSRPHAAHDFTRPCGCRATNRTYQRHHREAS